LNHLVDFFFRAGGGFYQRAYLIRLWDILEEKYRNETYDPRLDELAAFLAVEEDEDHRKWGRYPTNASPFPEDMLSNIEIIKGQIRKHRDFLKQFILRFHPSIPDHPRVKITEVMYLPENGNDKLEYLELVNTSPGEVDLSGWMISGIGFTFPAGSVVPAGSTFIVGKSPPDLRARYPGVALPLLFGPYPGKLADGGEEIRVLDAGPGFPATIDYLSYGDKSPWPELVPGHSIELTDTAPDSDNDRPENWAASQALGGSPGLQAQHFIRGDANLDGIVNLSDAIAVLNHLFRGGTPPACKDAADTTDDGKLDLTDAVLLLNHLFKGGPPPSPPYPEEGFDRTEDNLGC
jgi:hypothetical protein